LPCHPEPVNKEWKYRLFVETKMIDYAPAIPGSVTLGPGDVHVWSVELDTYDTRSLPDMLSEADKLRMSRLRGELGQERFLATRIALREVLAGYLRTAPEAIEFETMLSGKPYVSAPETPPGFSFNIAHSGGICLMAVGLFENLGIDVEWKRTARDLVAIADRFFAPIEARAVASLPADRLLDAFYAVWCRKEAYVKALGSGIGGGLDRFEVTVLPDEPARVLRVVGDSHEAARWTLCDLPAPSGFAAALALRGAPKAIALYQLKRPQ
jgi:4'-phosphopantetheinyl transferase